MDRVIKFRVWIPETPYVSNAWMCYNLSPDMLGEAICKTKESYKKYIVMQYIGLSDKNVKECYHKDIAIDKSNKSQTKWVVEWNEITACFVLKNPIHGELPIRCIKDMEITGNIYENPELLPEGKNE
jgi:hypothetical protein